MTGRAVLSISLRHGNVARWLTFLRERSPLPLLLLVGLAQSLSASAVVGGGFDAAGVAMATVAIVALYALLRLMDEVKDVARDSVAHPDRPLPRGLLGVTEVQRAIAGLGASLIGGSIVVGLAHAPVAGVLYAGAVGFAFLMYHEFFTPRLAAGNAFVYAITHQIVIVPIYLFAVACVAPSRALDAPAVWYALTGLGASFVVEVSRKLDPNAHPILRTYLRAHGRAAAAGGIVAGLSLLAGAAYRIDVHRIVWPFVALVLVAVPMLWLSPRRFRVIEAAAALLASVQILAPLIRHAWRALA